MQMAFDGKGASLVIMDDLTSRTTGYILSMYTRVIARRLPIPR